MIAYYFILFIVMMTIWLGEKSVNRRFFLLPIIFLSGLATIRSYKVGTDTSVYARDFLSSTDYKYYFFDPNIEFGYQYLVYTILRFSHEYYWLFLVTSLIIVSSMLYAIKKYSVNYTLSVYIYITFGFYTFFFNTLRQALALSICFVCVKFLVDKKIFKYFIVVFVASLFHVSAWIMLPFYFLVHFRLKVEYKVLLVLLASSVVSSLAISYLAQSNQRYHNYDQQADNAGGYLLIIFYTLIGFVLYFLGKKIRKTDHFYNVLEQVFLCGLVFVFPIILLGTDASGPQRILYNFTIYLIFLIPILIKNRFNTLQYKLIFSVLALIYFTLITQRLYGITPYIVNDFFRIF